ncbi:polyamine ABC transporter substrate-binding protein [Bosea sp. Root381]|uniref:ABC transporter substrate-binding protein n=1 Tax=Bosea sp. Root381 TaxID=1736524 RepID=UPI0006FD7308|nr:ABC transporter substrate-binding protein [Bosea sp. Root381]KRE05943.1 polyamine ABC transporter substrate-binding protein [Bosea sp. Root381]
MTLRSSLAALGLATALAGLPLSQALANGPTLNVGMAASDLGTLDPHRGAATQEKIVLAWMFNGLVRLKPGSVSLDSIEPDLAESWTISDDKKTWTFKLRQGVKFHGDFGEMTADDVVFSLKRAADPKQSVFSADFANIDTVEAVDPQTVKITLKNPSASLLYALVDFQGGYIVSKKAVEEYGADFKLKAVGTGPFAFSDYKASQSVTLTAHEGYFRGTPKIGQIVYRYIRSDASRDLAYTSGEIDLVYGRQDQKWAERMQTVKDTVLDVIEPAYQGAAYLNMSQKPLDDLRVRQAIAHAIDVKQVVAYKGALVSNPPKTIFPAATLGADLDAKLPAYDPEKAKALLKEAGFEKGLKLRVIASQNITSLGPAQIVQAQLKKVGIEIEMDVVEHATYHQQIRQNLSAIVVYGAARFPVAGNYLKEFYHSRSTVGTPTAVTNFSHCNAGDADIDAAANEVDQARQIALWKAAQEKIVAQLCAVPLFEQKLIWGRRKGLDYGYKLDGSLSYGPLITEQTTLTK